jgi:uncharacterized protein YdaL
VVLALVALNPGAGTAGKNLKPPKPPKDHPSASGLLGKGTTSTNGAVVGSTSAAISGGSGAPGAVGATTLVLYDTTGPYGWLGELYAMYAGNLASHFGSWTAQPVSSYQAGLISQYTATIYIGSTYDEPLPASFLDDVYNATRPVIWIYDNIWELTNRFSATFQSKYGWSWWYFDTGAVSRVVYKGVSLTRDSADNGAGIMTYSYVDPTKTTVLADAVHDSDGSTFPWALRSGTLSYVGENPFAYTSETDRVLAFDDLLFDALDPTAQTRHRALVRIEDINPTSNPNDLEAVTDYLYSQGIPFGFGVSPMYTDPLGYYNGGAPQTIRLKDSPVASVITYMQAHGGTPIMHGYTHQYSNVINPFTGVTGDDVEFFRVTENPDHSLDYVGPVAEDSETWALGRLDDSFSQFQQAGISAPQIFEFPHYVASVPAYDAVTQRFSTRWERAIYWGGVMSGGAIDYGHAIGQTFPYVVRDVYGTTVLPENIGAYVPQPFYSFPPHTVDDILNAADSNIVVRDGFASFYYHPFEGVAALRQIVDGLRARGWTFASPAQVAGLTP